MKFFFLLLFAASTQKDEASSGEFAFGYRASIVVNITFFLTDKFSSFFEQLFLVRLHTLLQKSSTIIQQVFNALTRITKEDKKTGYRPLLLKYDDIMT